MSPTKRLLNLVVVALVLGGAWIAREQGWIDAAPESGAAGTGSSGLPGNAESSEVPVPGATRDTPSSSAVDDADVVSSLYERGASGAMVRVSGTVKKALPDDNDGSRHQRFILRLTNGHTVLVAHNIDLAPRVPLDDGDTVEVRGQYEWNDQGGVLHWTHKDPRGSHDEGWIRLDGKTYE